MDVLPQQFHLANSSLCEPMRTNRKASLSGRL